VRVGPRRCSRGGLSRIAVRRAIRSACGTSGRTRNSGHSCYAWCVFSRDLTQAAKDSIASTTVSKRREWNRSKACCALVCGHGAVRSRAECAAPPDA
jgi:hypothetical protein